MRYVIDDRDKANVKWFSCKIGLLPQQKADRLCGLLFCCLLFIVMTYPTFAYVICAASGVGDKPMEWGLI